METIATSHPPLPCIDKIEPPNWWVGHSVNPVRVLLRGQGLNRATVVIEGTGVSLTPIQCNERGTYLFVDVTIAPDAMPGSRLLHVRTPVGETTTRFRLDGPLSTTEGGQGFSPEDVIYFVLPDRFCDGDPTNNDPAKSPGLYNPEKTRSYHGGDFAGIREKLPYLKDLGVTALWIAPIYDNADIAHPTLMFDGQHNIDYHGYGTIDYYGVEEHFGTLAELQALVAEAHHLGIKVIQDQVCNHVGPLHPWVEDAPTPTWFNGSATHHLDCDWNVWNLMNPHASPQTQQATLEGWFAGMLPDMNQNDPEVDRYLTQNSLWWLGTVGFDAIRQDTLPYVPRDFWQRWTTALKQQHPKLTILGEVNEMDPAIVGFFQGGRTQFDGIDTGVDTLFDYGLYGAIKEAFSGDHPTLRPLQIALAYDGLYPNPDGLVSFLSLHDVSCFRSLLGATYARLRVALTFLLTVRGTPMLYFGDEIGLRGADDPENRRHFPGGFPGDTRNAFTATGRTPQEQTTFQHVRFLLERRSTHPALRTGKMTDLWISERQYVFMRTDTAGDIAIIALSVEAEPVTIRIPVELLPLQEGMSLESGPGEGGQWAIEEGAILFRLPAVSSCVLTRL